MQLQIVMKGMSRNFNDHPINRFKRPIYYYLFFLLLPFPLYLVIVFDFYFQIKDGNVVKSTERAFWFGTTFALVAIGYLSWCFFNPKKRRWLLRQNSKHQRETNDNDN